MIKKAAQDKAPVKSTVKNQNKSESPKKSVGITVFTKVPVVGALNQVQIKIAEKTLSPHKLSKLNPEEAPRVDVKPTKAAQSDKNVAVNVSRSD